MKMITSLILALLVNNAIAGVGGSSGGSSRDNVGFPKPLKSIEDYDASLSYVVKWPTVNFASADVPIKDVCFDGNTIKTKSPIKYCIEKGIVEVCTKHFSPDEIECRKLRPNESTNDYSKIYREGCVKFEEKKLETPVTYQHEVCASWKRDLSTSQTVCTQKDFETKEYSSKYRIDIFQTGGKNRNNDPVKTLNYEADECVDVNLIELDN